MATMQINDTRKTNALPLLVLAALLAVLYFAVSQPSHHAVTNHGTNAWSATQRFKRADPNDDDYWQRECPDNRFYTFNKLPSVDGKPAWDVSIDYMEGGVLKNITRFTCRSANWIARKKEWCE